LLKLKKYTIELRKQDSPEELYKDLNISSLKDSSSEKKAKLRDSDKIML